MNFYKANYARLHEDYMRIDWNRELTGLDVDQAVGKFYSLLEPSIDTIPKAFFPSRGYPVYYSYELISLIKRKDSVRMKVKSEKRPVVRASLEKEFSDYRKLVKVGIKACFDDYVRDCEEKIKSNTKCFFAFTKSLNKTNSLPNSVKYVDEEASDRESVCNLFAKYFNSVYNPVIQPDSEVVPDPFTHQIDPNDMSFTPAEVEMALKRFDRNKVASPAGVPMMFFMHLSLSLSLPLSILFNKSLAECKFPSKWKTGFVSPIFKEGNKDDVANYRPISILCAISKVFERLVFNKLFDEVKSDIHYTQHGFFERRSTQSNLMEYVSFVADAMVAGGQVDTVYTDFAKAFDKVDHGTLLLKLRSFGLSNNMVRWFSTYLRQRAQFVVIGGSKST